MVLDDIVWALNYVKEKILGVRPDPAKLRLLDKAFEMRSIESFADMGGVWGVNGAYTFHVLSKYPIRHSYLVDDHFTQKVLDQRRKFGQPELLKGDFRYPKVYSDMDQVDLILLFDVLLHQVNWKEVLSLCADKTKTIVIHNPQFERDETVRLVDLGEKEYFRLVPHAKKGRQYETLFTENGEKDSPAVWQWGICDGDLVAALEELGFHLAYSAAGRKWHGNVFRSKGFIFIKGENI